MRSVPTKAKMLFVVWFIASLFCLAKAAGSQSGYEEIHGNGVYTVSEERDARERGELVRRDIETRQLVALADRTNSALSGIVRIGVLNLKRGGYYSQARELEQGWKQHDGELQRLVIQPARDIGDFEPLSKYLAVAYEILELKLGHKICYALRLTDIKTLNHAIPVVFRPCPYGLDEFTLHFVHDALYRGLAPVVTYWTTVITCSIATYGAGYFFICSPMGMVTELAMDRWIAPALAPRLFNLVCN